MGVSIAWSVGGLGLPGVVLQPLEHACMCLPVKVSTVDVVPGAVGRRHVPVVVRQARHVQLPLAGLDPVPRLDRPPVVLLDLVVQASCVAVLGCRMTFRCFLTRVLLAMCTLHDMFGHIAVGSSVLAVQDVFGWCKFPSPQERRRHDFVLGDWQARGVLVLRLVPRCVQHRHPVCQDRGVLDGAS